MRSTGSVNLPLHPGKAPRWLFRRMTPLSGAIAWAVVEEHGRAELVRRVADPWWFQAFCCVIGFDWHSSGTTTTGCGALKEALKDGALGVAVAGGKGRASRKAPAEIATWGERFSLPDATIADMGRATRLCAKVDSALVQDGYQLYHHCFFMTEDGDWSVVQQGMDDSWARRYHWLAEGLSDGREPYVTAPHTGIACDSVVERALDMTARESREARAVSVDLVNDGPDRLLRELRHIGAAGPQTGLGEFSSGAGETVAFGGRGGKCHGTGSRTGPVNVEDTGAAFPSPAPGTPPPTTTCSPHKYNITLPERHEVLSMDVTDRGWRELRNAYELQPGSYEELVALKGMGPKKVRALALVSQLVYGAEASWKDPVKFSFAHGGKDGIPYPVDRRTYDHSIQALRDALDSAEAGRGEKLEAIRRLDNYVKAKSPTSTRSSRTPSSTCPA